MYKPTTLLIAFAAVAVSTGVITGKTEAAARSYDGDSTVAPVQSDALAEAVAGKRGDGLAAALRRHCRLKTWSDFLMVYRGETLTDPYSGTAVDVTFSGLPADYTVAGIVSPKWWTDASQGAVSVYGDTVAHDLHNLVPVKSAILRETEGIPPGIPDNIISDHGAWTRGTVSLYGINIAVTAPCENQRGRIARAYLYMALMYPQPAMTPAGMMVMTDGGPSLSDYWRELLLKWNAEYPPTESEKRHAQLASAAQGGGNPLFLLPGIEEYLWGAKRGEVYSVSADDGAPVPLHGSYKLSETVFLSSPNVPKDAEWTIDGRSTTLTSVAASSLGVGSHELTYTSPSTHETGYVKIIIEQ